MRQAVESVSIARNGQVVLRMNGLDYWTNEGYLHALLSSKKLPADVFLLQGCELEFTKISHKAGERVLDGNSKPIKAGGNQPKDADGYQIYLKDGQRMERPALISFGGEAQAYRQSLTKQYAKQTAQQAVGSIFKKSERSAPADNISVNVEKDGSTNEPTKATQSATVGADDEDESL